MKQDHPSCWVKSERTFGWWEKFVNEEAHKQNGLKTLGCQERVLKNLMQRCILFLKFKEQE